MVSCSGFLGKFRTFDVAFGALQPFSPEVLERLRGACGRDGFRGERVGCLYAFVRVVAPFSGRPKSPSRRFQSLRRRSERVSSFNRRRRGLLVRVSLRARERRVALQSDRLRGGRVRLPANLRHGIGICRHVSRSVLREFSLSSRARPSLCHPRESLFRSNARRVGPGASVVNLQRDRVGHLRHARGRCGDSLGGGGVSLGGDSLASGIRGGGSCGVGEVFRLRRRRRKRSLRVRVARGFGRIDGGRGHASRAIEPRGGDGIRRLARAFLRSLCG